ncbi:MAG TPA: LamG domain-containing protein, partial [Sumerlaeia bacterium]|nr:LamG domain-containing protein [Sumerlaeia bacterium]
MKGITAGKRTQNGAWFATCAALAALVAAAAFAVKTNDVELGYSSVYDGQVRIQRSAEGQMTFRDAEITSPVLLSTLAEGVSVHGALTGLSADDHPQYLNDSRHSTAHDSDFNSSLTIPSDVAGNTNLGDHVTDSDIHLPRGETVEVTGDWRFSGTPQVWDGMNFSQNGAAGDVSLSFEAGSSDAAIQWDQSEDRFELNRGLQTSSDFQSGGDGTFAGDLAVAGSIYGELASPPKRAEYMHLAMNDNAASSTVTDETGHFHQILLDPGGDPNTDAHTTASLDGTTTGTMGRALAFDGSDDRIVVPASDVDPALAAGTDFTIAFWAKQAAVTDGNTKYFIYNVSTGANTGTRFTYSSSGVASWRLYYAAGVSPYLNPGYTADNTWRHHALTRREGAVTVYLNGGVSVTWSDTFSNDSLGDGRAMDLAGGSLATGRCKCVVDDFRIYADALSAGEIAALYNSGSGTASRARFVAELDGVASVDRLALDGDFTTSAARLQVSEGAYCDGNSWFNVSTRASKTHLAPVSVIKEWNAIDAIEVVEFAYRKRNPHLGGWLDPSGRALPADSPVLQALLQERGAETLTAQGYRVDRRRFLDEAEARRRLGFVAEDLR